MLNTLKHWWNEDEKSSHRQPELSLCITKLMVGMMAMDGKLDACEQHEIIKLLGDQFGLDQQESLVLIEQANTSDVRFNHIVHQITSEYDLNQRAEILGQIWQIALSDGEVDFLEEQYINRLSSLINVSPEALAEAKRHHEDLRPELQHAARHQPGNATVH